MLKRTKIIATLGPSTNQPEILIQLFKAGVNLVRVNFSHGSIEQQRKYIELARASAQSIGHPIGILADLQGPKIRVAHFKTGKALLKPGCNFVIDAGWFEAGDDHCVGVDYKDLPKDVNEGDHLLIDDGRIELKIDSVTGSRISCTVVRGGEISDHKGINLRGGGLNTGSITKKDEADIESLVELQANYLALSFIRDAKDITKARRLMGQAGRHINIIAKIERFEALEAIDEIIEAADGIMIARGDLGVEIDEAEVPGIQKALIVKTRHADKPIITATQMMDSMITNTIPTRAEVSDVANAVLDGTDAVMLSAETAIGKHPALVVNAVAKACRAAEKHPSICISTHRVHQRFKRVDEAIAMAAMYIANHMKIRAIIALTESGATPKWMSRIDSGIPIYGLSRHSMTCGRMSLYRGVYPIQFDITEFSKPEVNKKVIEYLLKQNLLSPGDLVLLTKGDAIGKHGSANTIKTIRVE